MVAFLIENAVYGAVTDKEDVHTRPIHPLRNCIAVHFCEKIKCKLWPARPPMAGLFAWPNQAKPNHKATPQGRNYKESIVFEFPIIYQKYYYGVSLIT